MLEAVDHIGLLGQFVKELLVFDAGTGVINIVEALLELFKATAFGRMELVGGF